MLSATIIVPTTIAVFIISYAVLADPIHIIIDVLIDAFNSFSTPSAEFENTMWFLETMFGAAVVFGVIMVIIWLFAWSHKYEHEQD